MAKILVTGGAGFIGSHIVDALIDLGHEVVIIDNLSTGLEKNLNPKAKFYKMDVLSEEISSVFEKERIEFVFHKAAQMNVRKSVEDPLFDAKVNIEGILNVLKNCHAFGVKKIIFASSGGAIYGDGEQIPTMEDAQKDPASPYGIAKFTSEMYLSFYQKVYGVPFIALRYANVYGPRQNPLGEAGVVAVFGNMVLRNQTPTINGDGEQTRDFVYVSDVVAANMLALKSDRTGSYNVGTGKETNVNEVFVILNKVANTTLEPVHGPAKPGEQKRSCLSFGKIQTELGWEPKVTLEQGITNVLDFLKKQI